MRVIAGKAKGHKLKAPSGRDVRPTTDRVKESLFNILMPYLPDSVVLDLFSGTGGLGIEALSRGARWAVFVDNSPGSVRLIRENLKATRLEDLATVYTSDVMICLDKLADSGICFDIILMDPPYGKGFIEPVLERIDRHDLLKPEGIIVAEKRKSDELADQIGQLEKYRVQTYGDVQLCFFKKAGSAVDEHSGTRLEKKRG